MDFKVLFYFFHFILFVVALENTDDEDIYASGSGSNKVVDVSSPEPLTTSSHTASTPEDTKTAADTPMGNGFERYMTAGIAVSVMSVVIVAVLSVCLVSIVKRNRRRQEKLATMNQRASDPQCLVISNQTKTNQQREMYLTPTSEPNVYSK